MMRRNRQWCVVAAGAMVAALLPFAAAASVAAAPAQDPGSAAEQHLRGDATGQLRIRESPSGPVTFVGTPHGTAIDNPDVHADQSVTQAARAHLRRYGAAFGTGRPGTTFDQRSTTRSVSGVDVVTYRQQVRGVPVIGGELVLSLGPDHDVRSILARTSDLTTVPAATIDPAEAIETARGIVAKHTDARELSVTDEGRWLLDPKVLSAPVPGAARGVWRFEVTDGAAVRRLVLIDDRTGSVVVDVDLIAHLDRVVCDGANTPAAQRPCVDGFARTESSEVSPVPDVNSAFDLAGAVADTYADVAGVDLTDLIGIDVAGARKLASTARFCPQDDDAACPWANAFWNGTQMFYGDGFAGADDVVGHEMTHGFIEHTSKLFYWGESGAINESLADVIGEIVDHRHRTPGEDNSQWDLGEDLPGGAARSMKDPTVFHDPDTMTSTWYDPDPNYLDEGGVHTNSGVGNKTAYLISQGGAFNGQTMGGIDGSDPDLTKTATLYLDAIPRLSSGSDYADLAAVLDQSCADLAGAGTAGFTGADCTVVHAAGVATELRTTPTALPREADAVAGCPPGTTKRLLLDGEADPANFDLDLTSSAWQDGNDSGWGSNATSGVHSWFAADPDESRVGSLVMREIQLPPGQLSYLWFQGWRLLEYGVDEQGAPAYYDGGTVEVGTGGGPVVPAPEAWVNGPQQQLSGAFDGVRAFGGDSHGWVASRLDLSSWAGSTVQPRFTLRADQDYGFIGWYLDDVRIYTCDIDYPSAARGVRTVGAYRSATVRWWAPSTHPEAVTGYRVTRQGGPTRLLPATARSATFSNLAQAAYTFRVQALGPAGHLSAAASATVRPTRTTMSTARRGARVRFVGRVLRGTSPVAHAQVVLQRHVGQRWLRVRALQARVDGRFAVSLTTAQRADYHAVFVGGAGVLSSVSAVRRR